MDMMTFLQFIGSKQATVEPNSGGYPEEQRGSDCGYGALMRAGRLGRWPGESAEEGCSARYPSRWNYEPPLGPR